VSRIFFGFFALGLVLALAFASFYPLPAPVRIPSLITVQPDGGRREEFVIRWPDDRISLPADARAARTGTAAAADIAGALVVEDAAGRRASGEVFRLRDSAGNVVGVASRVSTGGGGMRPAADWMLVIPGRGALLVRQSDAVDLGGRFTADGRRRVTSPGQLPGFWPSDRQVTVTGPGGGAVVHGTREFAGLAGSLRETRVLDEVGPDGTTRGRILLATTLRRPQ
jgi:hypothetical protein